MDRRDRPKTRLVLTLLFFQLEALGYLLVNGVSSRRRSISLLTDADAVVPFQAQSLWLYLSMVPYFFFATLDVASVRRLVRIFVCIAIASFVSFRSFLKFPSCYPRAPVQPEGEHLRRAWTSLRAVDRPANTFPSLHVGNTFLLAFILSRELPQDRSEAYLLWALLLSLSTLNTQQHYVVDVTGGLLVAEGVATHVYQPWQEGHLSWRAALARLRQLCQRLDALARTPAAFRLPADARHPCLQQLLRRCVASPSLSAVYLGTDGRQALFARAPVLLALLRQIRPPMSLLLSLLPGWLQFIREFEGAAPQLSDEAVHRYLLGLDGPWRKGMDVLFDFSGLAQAASARLSARLAQPGP